jgi:hypothetical protein
VVGAAKPVGEGRYQIVAHRGHTELAYVLELPEQRGPSQEEFEIQDAASYIVAVKNPDVSVPGFPSREQGPRYPGRLRDKFGDRRWIAVEDPQLLDYEGAQIVLLGARTGDVERELGIEIDEKAETALTAEIFQKLRLPREEARLKPLIRGEFPAHEMPRPGEEVERTAPTPARRRARRAAGRAAATRAPSAAAMTKLLRGLDFPASKSRLVAHAERQGPRSGVRNPEVAFEVLRALPRRTYRSMKDIATGLGRVR